MGDFRVLKTQTGIDHEAVSDIVEKWLKDRQEGPPLAAVAIVAVHADGSIGTMYDCGDKYFSLVGAMIELQHRMMRDGSGGD